MKTLVPNYYRLFSCIAGKCRHTCCEGWEIDVDAESLPRFLSFPDVAPHIELTDTPHVRLSASERCPFLQENGLCRMILSHGEESLCQICRDHPRFRNFWTSRTEIGLGLVCEEAARLILTYPEPLRLEVLDDDGADVPLPDDEAYLWHLREQKLAEVTESGPRARLREYLLFRHLPDALYDGREEERLRMIDCFYREITAAWEKTDQTTDALVETARTWSYDVEYDDEAIGARLEKYEQENEE